MIKYKNIIYKLFNKLSSISISKILFSALTIRVIWIIAFPQGPVADFEGYNKIAVEYAKNGSFIYPSIPYLPVGSIFIIGVIYKLLGVSILWVKIFNIILSIFTIFLFHRIATKLFNKSVGNLFAILYSIYPSNISMVNITAPEIIMTFLLALFIYIFTFYDDKLKKYILMGVTAGALLYVKPVFIFTIFVPIIYHFVNKNFRISLKSFIVPITALIMLLPFCYHYGHFFLFDTNGGVNLFAGNNSMATGSYFNIYQKDIKEIRDVDFNKLDTFEKDNILKENAINFIIKNPIKFLTLVPKRIFFLLFKDTSAVTLSFSGLNINQIVKLSLYLLNIFFYYAIMVSFILSLSPGFIKKYTDSYIIIGLFIISHLAIYMVSVGMDRYKFSLMPLFIILSSLLLYNKSGKDNLNLAKNNNQ